MATQESENAKRVMPPLSEPMFSFRQAAEMIPMPTMQSLYMLLQRNKEAVQPYYKREFGHVIGMLTKTQIEHLRAVVYSGVHPRLGGKRGSTGKFPKGAIGAIMRRAMAVGLVLFAVGAGGCISSVVEALAKDDATFCTNIMTAYGNIKHYRTKSENIVVKCTMDQMEVRPK